MPQEHARPRRLHARSPYEETKPEFAVVSSVRVFRREARDDGIWAVIKGRKIDSSSRDLAWQMNNPDATDEERNRNAPGEWLDVNVYVSDPELMEVLRYMRRKTIIAYEGNFRHKYYKKNDGSEGLEVGWRATSLRIVRGGLDNATALDDMISQTQEDLQRARERRERYRNGSAVDGGDRRAARTDEPPAAAGREDRRAPDSQPAEPRSMPSFDRQTRGPSSDVPF